ncbi:MAG: ABC transporter permease [Oscillospiraceae bacterium]|nr:ABC transporter permease [Oscillospiraceae bacterium]
MNAIYTIFLKQIKETSKNKTILVQFLMFPILAIIMENTITINHMPEHFFAKLFAVMFVGMCPLTCMSAIIAEEKEKNTLRVLMMSHVTPMQYLLGTSLYIFAMCMVGTLVFTIIADYKNTEITNFLIIMAIGIILSILVGSIIGIISQNQMSATSLTLPVMMIFSFLPMLSMFNETIEKIAKIIYSQQISILINGNYENISDNILIVLINFILAVLIFIISYHKKGLE